MGEAFFPWPRIPPMRDSAMSLPTYRVPRAHARGASPFGGTSRQPARVPCPCRLRIAAGPMRVLSGKAPKMLKPFQSCSTLSKPVQGPGEGVGWTVSRTFGSAPFFRKKDYLSLEWLAGRWPAEPTAAGRERCRSRYLKVGQSKLM